MTIIIAKEREEKAKKTECGNPEAIPPLRNKIS